MCGGDRQLEDIETYEEQMIALGKIFNSYSDVLSQYVEYKDRWGEGVKEDFLSHLSTLMDNIRFWHIIDIGECDECGAKWPIGRGGEFHWHEDSEAWYCNKCADDLYQIVIDDGKPSVEYVIGLDEVERVMTETFLSKDDDTFVDIQIYNFEGRCVSESQAIEEIAAKIMEENE